MILFWILVVAFGICCRLAFTVVSAARRLLARGTGYQPLAGLAADGLDADEAALAKGPPPPSLPLLGSGRRRRRTRVWLRRYVTLPAAFGYRCAQDFGWYTVPPRVQSLTIAVFVLLNVLSCILGYRTFPGNL